MCHARGNIPIITKIQMMEFHSCSSYRKTYNFEILKDAIEFHAFRSHTFLAVSAELSYGIHHQIYVAKSAFLVCIEHPDSLSC